MTWSTGPHSNLTAVTTRTAAERAPLADEFRSASGAFSPCRGREETTQAGFEIAMRGRGDAYGGPRRRASRWRYSQRHLALHHLAMKPQ